MDTRHQKSAELLRARGGEAEGGWADFIPTVPASGAQHSNNFPPSEAVIQRADSSGSREKCISSFSSAIPLHIFNLLDARIQSGLSASPPRTSESSRSQYVTLPAAARGSGVQPLSHCLGSGGLNKHYILPQSSNSCVSRSEGKRPNKAAGRITCAEKRSVGFRVQRSTWHRPRASLTFSELAFLSLQLTGGGNAAKFRTYLLEPPWLSSNTASKSYEIAQISALRGSALQKWMLKVRQGNGKTAAQEPDWHANAGIPSKECVPRELSARLCSGLPWWGQCCCCCYLVIGHDHSPHSPTGLIDNKGAEVVFKGCVATGCHSSHRKVTLLVCSPEQEASSSPVKELARILLQAPPPVSLHLPQNSGAHLQVSWRNGEGSP
ncbi:uncharacterized protein LOC125168460 [Prionailurus viverrinus]|uniref:uncharacterized protein LOC125168460 n=1 Tax=Prionailurus viverrinus TaxID=61388 RepID=UPI001FF0FD6E|nr:uncharacterized protein LOC125168460 [Prionailurus viverrinus]